MSQPARLLVVLKENGVSLPPGHMVVEFGPYRGKKAYKGVGWFGHYDMLNLKWDLSEKGAEVAFTFADKRKATCTMYCDVPHHEGHTQECCKRGKK